MAEAFGIGAGIVGVIGLTIQITQVVVQFGLDWHDAPHDVKSFMAELQTLKTVLSETNTNILLNPDFAEAFQNQPSLLLSQLGPSAPSTTDTKFMLAACQRELESLLSELKKKARGHRIGWERFKAAFLAKETRESVENLHRQCQTLNSMVTLDATVLGAITYKEVKEARKDQQETRKEQQAWHQAEANQEILNWLTKIDYGAQRTDFFNRRQEGTGQWLLNSGEFQRWSDEDNQTLFCQGMPGAGKTIITSIVVDHLTTKYQNNNSIGIAYIYCNFQQQHEQKPTDLFMSLLKQLIQGLSSVPESVKSLYERHKGKQIQRPFDEISKILHSIVAGYFKAFIIIDALGECQVSYEEREKLLSALLTLQTQPQINLFATSRPVPEITSHFERCTLKDIRALDDDILSYVNGRMSHLRRPRISKYPDLQDAIRREVVRAADGMFLLAKLHMDPLLSNSTPGDNEDALKCLPRGIEKLDTMYEQAMERINNQMEGSRVLANKVLSWVTHAKRPLTSVELQHALAVRDGMMRLNDKFIPEVEDLVSDCAGLVTVNEKSNIVRLIHYTTQEYFERTSWFPDAERDIERTCIIYLSFNTFETGFCGTEEEFEARLELNPLYDYAAQIGGIMLVQLQQR